MQRLKTRPQFQAVLAGSVIAKTEHFVLHRSCLKAVTAQANSNNHLAAIAGISMLDLFPVQDVWIGAMVPKRWARRAVTRNVIKRQIYNVSADFQQSYTQAVFLVRLRREFSSKEFISASSVQLKNAVRHEVQALMKAGASPI